MTTNAIARVDMSPGAVQARINYALALADSGLLPPAYRRQPANVLLAVELGSALGIAPVTAINGINVIDGKPTISPALMTALVRGAGHKVRTSMAGSVEGGDLAVTCTVIRSDDPGHPFTSTWTMQRAERAGLGRLTVDEKGRHLFVSRSRQGNPQAWEKFTEAMCQHRAESESCRMGAEDVLQGVHYTPEELGAAVNAEGEYVDAGEVTVTSTPQAPPTSTPAGDATQATQSPSTEGPKQDTADPDAVARMTEHAHALAVKALKCPPVVVKDGEEVNGAAIIRATLDEAKARDYGTGAGDILHVDVYKSLTFADIEALGIPDDVAEVELGRLLFLIGPRLKAGDGPVRPVGDPAGYRLAETGDGDVVVEPEVEDDPAPTSGPDDIVDVETTPEVDPWADGGGFGPQQGDRHEPKPDPHGLRDAIRRGRQDTSGGDGTGDLEPEPTNPDGTPLF